MAEKSERAQRPAAVETRAGKEEKILQFWKENKIFEKSLEKDAPKGEFVFYEGPPTANGRPGIHHIEARAFKDAIPRYKTMQGYKVPRKGGWDTHGLPVELEVEKQLGLKSKKEIEQYGIARFNEECKKSVWKYVDEWYQFTDRMGYWVDMANAYVTYHNSYIESVWSILAHVEKKDLLYKDYKVLPWCPRCGTALSSHELAQGYQDVKDISLYVKFKVKGEKNTYLIAWTTTPWTLPGNVALAVGEDIEYKKFKVVDPKNSQLKAGDTYILSNDFFLNLGFAEGSNYTGPATLGPTVLNRDFEGVIVDNIQIIKGKALVGLEYEPNYVFFENNYDFKQVYEGDNAFRIYPADFVTTEDGTGIVHTAVMYGQEDFELGTKVGLPKFHLVNSDGVFIPGTGWLEGRSVVDETLSVDILKDLQGRGLLFDKENHTHSYPFCWRCKTRLIYYARDSWYIAMSKLRNELVKENEKINWEPEYIKEGRFGEWLREIKDWAISRERYWGTPLPVWESLYGNKKKIVVDSVETLKKYTKKSGNKFIFIRHGESENNVENICNADPTKVYHLTEQGRKQIEKRANEIEKADAIYASPFVRAIETAEIIAEKLGFDKTKIKEDKRLRELDFGDFDGKPFDAYLEYDKKHILSYDTKLPNGESYNDAKRRFGEFLYEIDRAHHDETIIVSTHGMGLEAVEAIIVGADKEMSLKIINTPNPNFHVGGMIEFDFVPLSHNGDFELDLHKPYIDEIILEKDGEEYKRVKEVMDVWFDSGAMPFAQDPENVRYPADFISEAIDQTRGWFYTLHAIGVLMEKGRAYKNVISLGHILDKEGKKMSKSVGNVVNPWEMIDKYGVDTLRLWMYSVNQPGESKNFDERTVDELQKRVFNLLDNVYSFYELYRDKELETYDGKFTNPSYLDTWIMLRVTEVTQKITEYLNNYKLLEPVRELRNLIEDLSTWYLRRTREEIKAGNKDAKKRLFIILGRVSILLAPFAPFAAEDLYQKLKRKEDPESVHLYDWPVKDTVPPDADERLSDMKKVREIVSLALDLRNKAGIKVRQPLVLLKIKNKDLDEEYLDIIKDELNVKSVVVDRNLAEEVNLDTTLTPELKEEGKVRDAIRAVQEWRKENNLRPGDKVEYKTNDQFLFKHRNEIENSTNVKLIEN